MVSHNLPDPNDVLSDSFSSAFSLPGLGSISLFLPHSFYVFLSMWEGNAFELLK